MKKLFLVVLCLGWCLVIAVACLSEGREAVISAEDGFSGCEGHEKPYHLAWADCMGKMGADTYHALERCQGYAKALACHKPPPLPPCKCEEDKKALKHCEDKRKDCVAAKNEQQELRFWKRCGVIRPGDHNQWAECEGAEGAADAACSPLYRAEVDPAWCSGGNKERWERMRRDGVTWINCKEGEVCP
jgi:hypothetical protein